MNTILNAITWVAVGAFITSFVVFLYMVWLTDRVEHKKHVQEQAEREAFISGLQRNSDVLYKMRSVREDAEKLLS